jgi:hypothetical protein
VIPPRGVRVSYTTPRPISIVVMQQFCKLQRRVQFSHRDLNYLEIPDSSMFQSPSGQRQEPAKFLFVGSNPTWNSYSIEFNGIIYSQVRKLVKRPRFERGHFAGSKPALGLSPCSPIGRGTILRG